MSYMVDCLFRRDFWDDLDVVCADPTLQTTPLKNALQDLLETELRRCFENEDVAPAGRFEVKFAYNFDFGTRKAPTKLGVTASVAEWRVWLLANETSIDSGSNEKE
jgi:hypothetical protein